MSASPRQRAGITFLMCAAALSALAWLQRGDGLDAAARARPRNPLVQVRLLELNADEAVELDIRGAWQLASPQGKVLARGSGMRSWIRAEPQGASVGGWQSEVDHLLLSTFGDDALVVGTQRYRGRLHLYSERRRGRLQRLKLILELPLEDYVLGVVTGEMATATPGIAEALQAQAVAARTYALYQLAQGRSELASTAADQRFLSLDFETRAARAAVAATRGRILTRKGELVPAYFHADCGGHTSPAGPSGFDASPVLGGSDDQVHGALSAWSDLIPAERLDQIADRLGLGTHLTSLQVLERDPGGRILRAKLVGPEQGRELPGERLRQELRLRSAYLTSMDPRSDGTLEVRGRGHGHGIGMCQSGALQRARDGASCKDILRHYYPGAQLTLLSTPAPR